MDEWGNKPPRRFKAYIAVIAVGVVMFGLGNLSGNQFTRWLAQSPLGGGSISSGASLAGSALSPISTTQSGTNTITQIYDRAKPSIFTITTVTNSKTQGTQEGIGTGFLIDNNGDIATNYHVVSGSKTVTVSIGSQNYTGTVIGADPIDDLAIVHITPIKGMNPLPLGTAKTLQPGQPLIAIGNPFQLTDSVTSGIVSGLNRSMASVSGRLMSGLIQTDAPINPGNSGGPLFNSAGQVVGINTMIESPVKGFVGIGFAIPIDRLERLLPQLLKGQTIQHAWLGISGLTVDPGVQQQYHLPVSQGVLVITTLPNSPAAKAGIHGDTGGTNNPVGNGDIITAVNGTAVASVSQLTAALNNYSVGSTISVSVLRHDKPMTIKVTLGNWPSTLP